MSDMENKVVSRRIQSMLAAVVLMLSAIDAARAAVDETGVTDDGNAGPVVMLQNITHRLVSKMGQDIDLIKKDDSYLMVLADDVLIRHFDINAMSRWVLGSHRKSLSGAQQQHFAQEFQKLVIRFYVSALFSDPELLDEIIAMGDRVITFEPITWGEQTKKVVVKSVFSIPGGDKVPVHFRLYLSKRGAWLIYDVKVDGISLITNYRNSFAAEIRKDGFDTMLARLIKKNGE